MDIGVLYKVNKVTDSNYLGYNLSPYGKWIYYEYAKNDNGTALPSYIPGHTTTTSNPNGVAIAGGDTFSAQVAGAIQEGIWSQLTDNGVVDWPATGWGSPTDPTNAYNTVSAAESWSSHFQSNDDPTFATYENAIGIAQLQLTADGVTQDEQNQMVMTCVMNQGGGPPIPEPATIVVWSLLGAAGWLGMRVWRRRAA